MQKVLRFLFSSSLVIFLIGCMSESHINMPVDNQTAADQPVFTSIPTQPLHHIGEPLILRLPEGSGEPMTANGVVTPSLGGKVEIKRKWYDPHGNKTVDLNINLKVPAGAVNEKVTLTMTIDPNNLLGDVVFAPHGTMFSKPAMLNVSVTGLDLSGLATGDIDIFYVLNGAWVERNVAKSVKINRIKGSLTVSDAPLNHFSRYAFGRAM